jgi:hypothetical protein
LLDCRAEAVELPALAACIAGMFLDWLLPLPVAAWPGKAINPETATNNSEDFTYCNMFSPYPWRTLGPLNCRNWPLTVCLEKQNCNSFRVSGSFLLDELYLR